MQTLAAERADVLGHRLPHLARAVAGVVELRDQRLDLVVLVAEERGLGRREERQALDPLCRPIRADLRGGHAPHLLGVGLEEVVEQALAEAVGHPLLEGLLFALGLELGPQIGEQRACELHGAELLDHVRAAQRIVEELLVPVDARHARALEELLAHDLVPEVVDLLDLGEEAVAAEVEAVAVAHRRLGDAAHLVLGLQHDHRQPLLGKQVAGGQARGPTAEDHRRLLAHLGRASSVVAVLLVIPSSSRRGPRARRCASRGGSWAVRLRPARSACRRPERHPTGRSGASRAESRARPSRRPVS